MSERDAAAERLDVLANLFRCRARLLADPMANPRIVLPGVNSVLGHPDLSTWIANATALEIVDAHIAEEWAKFDALENVK